MDIAAAIDKAVRDSHSEECRGHLGASQIGGRCARKAWYGFRWAYQEKHLGRMLRLFSRGHEEEHRFVRYLRLAGFEVQDYAQRLMYHSGSDSYLLLEWDDADNEAWAECDDVSEDPLHLVRASKLGQGPSQWSFRGDTDCPEVPAMSHFSGSGDGKVRGKGLPEGWGLLECKTHNDKSFKILQTKAVLTAKPEHWVQMQIYMKYFGLKWALYIAVNKNDDELYCEIVYYREEVANGYADAAQRIIESQAAPKRLTEDPSWFECRYCAFREICHKGAPPQKNCRSCQYAQPIAGAKWYCSLHHGEIPDSFIAQGCDRYEGIK